jgi:hypothetical protein
MENRVRFSYAYDPDAVGCYGTSLRRGSLGRSVAMIERPLCLRLFRRDLSGMPGLNPTPSCRGSAIVSRCHHLRALPARCPRMTCSTKASPNGLVKGPERNNKR